MTSHTPIHTIDLNFQGIPETIAAYLIPHARGAALVECGPGSTLPALTEGLADHGLTPADVTDVLITHIHLDHAGAAGWLARQGARVHVHHVGAPHIINPEKLLISAGRIYGDLMDQLWGEFVPVPEERINILHDNDEVEIEGLVFRALDTPGHAYHHITYLLDGVCFSGDNGGVRLPGTRALRLPTPPPEFHLEKWRTSIQRLRGENIRQIAATHFGVHSDAGWHLDTLARTLDEIETWAEAAMSTAPTRDKFRQQFATWMQSNSVKAGLDSQMIAAYDVAISSQMSADGLWRYWNKFRGG